jgi:hypothetical protein
MRHLRWLLLLIVLLASCAGRFFFSDTDLAGVIIGGPQSGGYVRIGDKSVTHAFYHGQGREYLHLHTEDDDPRMHSSQLYAAIQLLDYPVYSYENRDIVSAHWDGNVLVCVEAP